GNIQDKYICTVDYVGGPNAPKITKTARHALIVQMGIINSAPKDAVKIGSMKDAVNTMVRQIVTNPLNDLAKDPGFQSASAAPPALGAQSATEPASPGPPASAPSPAAPANAAQPSAPGPPASPTPPAPPAAPSQPAAAQP
ncbi:MAG: hypothetical protein ACHP7N_07775, partial [Caulobacterales bacterium]